MKEGSKHGLDEMQSESNEMTQLSEISKIENPH